MYTEISTIEELKQLFIEGLLNHTNKVTKVDNLSVLSGISYGAAKTSQKAIKDIALLEARVFPDSAYSTYLDDVAENNGISPRFTASGSSCYLRLVGTPGTTYVQFINTFTGDGGIVFDLEGTVTIGADGYTYAKVRSQSSGVKTNVLGLAIKTVSPVPSGHQYVINEYKATGGRDAEDDNLFRQRIKNGPNILSRGTIAMLEQVFMKINSNVLRVFYNGIDSLGKVVLAVLTQNGISLTAAELNTLLLQGQEYFALTELKTFGTQTFGIYLQNQLFQPVDISFRVELFSSVNPDDVRKEIQIKFAKKYDFRYWDSTMRVEWDDLLQLVKDTNGVKYVPDQWFYPNNDVIIDKNKLPRFRGFLMIDLAGHIISNSSGSLSPVFYPNQADFSYAQTVLTSI